MSDKLNPIRKSKVKASLLQGKSARQALRDGNYPESVVNHSTSQPCVKVCMEEIERDVKSKITVESVLTGLNHIQALAIAKGDYATATRCEELKGKWLAMFTDKLETATVEKEEAQFSLERLSRIKQANTQ